MKKLLILTVVLILLLTLAPAAMAENSSYTYTIRHEVELQLDGDFTFTSDVSTPAQGDVSVGLSGVGTAYMKSALEIIERNQVSGNWYDLF